jgi:hypothetical protein
VYRDIPTKSRYKDIENLIPRLTYAVLINHPEGRQSVRLYFNSDDINSIPAPRRTSQYLPPLSLPDGVYSDKFNPNNSTVTDPMVYRNYSHKSSQPQANGIGEQYKFLHCFYIPFITNHLVFFTLVSEENKRIQQHYLYQTNHNKFKVSHPKGIKFLLDAEKFPHQRQKQTENYLIQAYRRFCQGGNITKNGEALNKEQLDKIQELRDLVTGMEDTCTYIQQLHYQDQNFDSGDRNDVDFNDPTSISPQLTNSQPPVSGGQDPPETQQKTSQNSNSPITNASSTTPTNQGTQGGSQDPPQQNTSQNSTNVNTNASSTTPTDTVTPDGGQNLPNSQQNTSQNPTNVNSNNDSSLLTGGSSHSQTSVPPGPNVTPSNNQNPSTFASNSGNGSANESSNTSKNTVSQGGSQAPTLQEMTEMLKNVKNPNSKGVNSNTNNNVSQNTMGGSVTTIGIRPVTVNNDNKQNGSLGTANNNNNPSMTSDDIFADQLQNSSNSSLSNKSHQRKSDSTLSSAQSIRRQNQSHQSTKPVISCIQNQQETLRRIQDAIPQVSSGQPTSKN